MFNNIKPGKYTAIFFYDSSNYSATTYRKEGVSDSENSDAIDKTVIYGEKAQVAAVTEEIIVADENRYNIDLEVKEPNDIVYNNKKIGGILTETKLMAEQVKYMVLGIGINTNKENFTKDIKDIATSIKKEFGIDVKTEKFVADFCNRFENKIIKCIGE